jgi:hypothetical protein
VPLEDVDLLLLFALFALLADLFEFVPSVVQLTISNESDKDASAATFKSENRDFIRYTPLMF